MIKITRTTSEDGEVVRLQVEGRVVLGTALELTTACRAGLATGKAILLDLTGVVFVDPEGARSVHAATESGVVVIGGSPFVAELLRSCRAGDAGAAPADAATVEESALLEGLRRGDDAAFDELVRLHGGRMLAVARRMLRSEEEARDAVQEALLSAFKAVREFQGGARLSTWLHRIVVNAALMRLRTRRRKPEESLDDLLPRFDEQGEWAEEVERWATPSELVERGETRALVRRCIDRLPEPYRAILVLRDIEDLDTDEAAAALGISINAAKTRLHRARQALRTLIGEGLAGDVRAAS
jgi:RNA polymerase sigma-70 factor (ECF subfamily)